MKKAAGLFLTLCLVGLFTTSCIAVPTPAKHKVRGQTFTDTSHPFTPGKTTKKEILASLGSPTAIWEKENVWIYSWDESRSGWLIAFGGPYGNMGGAEYARNWKNKINLLRFNDQGVLTDMKIEDRPKLNNTGQYLMDWVYGEGSRESKLWEEEQKKVSVLLRLVTSSDDQLDVKWDEKWFYEIAARLGGFETGGLIRDKRKEEKIGKDLWYEGWLPYDVEPGDLYFSFFHVTPSIPGPGEYIDDEFSMPPVFHVEVPLSDTPIYLGSFHFNRRTFIEASWSQNAVYKDYRFVEIIDEGDLARQIAAEISPEYSSIETSLAFKHEGPVILNTPPNLN